MVMSEKDKALLKTYQGYVKYEVEQVKKHQGRANDYRRKIANLRSKTKVKNK